jgi:hypothetical protein
MIKGIRDLSNKRGAENEDLTRDKDKPMGGSALIVRTLQKMDRQR